MGLLKSVNNVPGIDNYEYRDQDYWNKYEYRARFVLVGVRYIWYANRNIKELIDILDSKSSSQIRTAEKEEARKNIPKLEQFVVWREAQKKNKNATIRIEHNTVAVFSNDLASLKQIENSISGLEVMYTQVQKSNFAGVKQFVRKPKHNFRIYLKSKRVESSFASDLYELLSKNKNLHASPALCSWIENGKNIASSWRYRYTSAGHFIDYDNESTLSYLALMHGELLGKRYKLEMRP